VVFGFRFCFRCLDVDRPPVTAVRLSAPGPGQRVPNFRCVHPSTLQFTMGDGSVRSVKPTINHTVYKGLSTVAGGEILSADQY
jgi:hypothetical protein